jgi:cytoskeletal protein RodZ
MYGRAMPSDRFDQLWTSDWRTLAEESAPGDTPEAREAQAVMAARTGRAQAHAAAQLRRLVMATIAVALAAVLLAVAVIVLTVTEDDQDTREGGNQDRELTDEEQQERDERREERRAEREAEREEEQDTSDSTDTTDTTQPVTETTAG